MGWGAERFLGLPAAIPRTGLSLARAVTEAQAIVTSHCDTAAASKMWRPTALLLPVFKGFSMGLTFITPSLTPSFETASAYQKLLCSITRSGGPPNV